MRVDGLGGQPTEELHIPSLGLTSFSKNGVYKHRTHILAGGTPCETPDFRKAQVIGREYGMEDTQVHSGGVSSRITLNSWLAGIHLHNLVFIS